MKQNLEFICDCIENQLLEMYTILSYIGQISEFICDGNQQILYLDLK